MKGLKCAFLIVSLVVSIILIAGCNEKTGNSKTQQAAMIISIPKGDPFIDLAYSGLEELGNDKGLDTKIIEALDKSEYEEQIRSMAELGANPIYVLWDDLGAAVLEVAPDFPDTKFIIGDAYVESDLSNVKTIVVEPQEAAFLAGFVAAKTSENNHIAFVGSQDTPIINRFKVGYEAGAKHASPDITVESVYVGNANDPLKGQEIAKLVIGNGADVVMHAANKSGLGVIKGAEENNAKAIGVDEWQGKINEDVVFWSALKDIAGAIYKAGESVLDDKFEPGLQKYDISTGIKMYDERDYEKLSEDLKNEVKQIEEDIMNGKIEVPTPVN
ncbi:BMP family ABC transporter substrate-binding protein [Bacillus sp. IITD106]|nr:BMP family ABC transporter substrate-binding protein [Bacillus sp. IITD106]